MEQLDVPERGTAFFRIAKSDPPTASDFLSNLARGRSFPNADPETLRLAGGVSVFAEESQARRQAARFPMLGAFIAEMRIPEDAPIRSERTTTRQGHYTLWGDSDEMLRCVVRVVTIQ